MEIAELLKAALKHLEAVDTAVNEITKRDPEILNQPHLQAILQQFYHTYAEAKERLEHPTFRIATIGTTSSGKSTLVNALIGHRIAPIEAQEMSAGILRIHHSLQNRLVIHPTIGWQNLTDEDIYNKIKQYMADYHERKKVEPNLPLPEIEVYCPILPVIDRSKTGLPESVNIEILDLPGLKSINDQKHLKLIQDTIKGCFSIVTINYQETDDEKQETLLRELKHVVEWFGGDPKMMIFILNKIDSHTSEDDSIENRIQNLKAQIQTTLGLGTPPEVIPMTALFLYYAQLISSSQLTHQLNALENLLCNCSNIFAKKERNDNELRSFHNTLRNKSENKELLTPEESQKLLDYALNLSGANLFWRTLRECCQSSFQQSVLAPALLEFIIVSQSLEVQLRTILEIKRKTSIDEIEKERQHIKDKENKIKEIIKKNFQDFFINKLGELKKVIESKDATNENNKINELGLPEDCQGDVTKTIDFSNDLERFLLDEIIVPIKDYLKGNINEISLNSKLKELLEQDLLDRLVKNCKNFNKTLDDSIDSLIQALDQNKKDQISILVKKAEEKIERAIIALKSDIEEALQQRTKFLIQTQRYTLENFANCYVESTVKELIDECSKILPNLNIPERIRTQFKANQGFSPNVDDLLNRLELEKVLPFIPDTSSNFFEEFINFLLKLFLNYHPKVDKIKKMKEKNIDNLTNSWESSLKKFKHEVYREVIEWLKEIIKNLENRIKIVADTVLEASLEQLKQQIDNLQQKEEDLENEIICLNQQLKSLINHLNKLNEMTGIKKSTI